MYVGPRDLAIMNGFDSKEIHGSLHLAFKERTTSKKNAGIHICHDATKDLTLQIEYLHSI